MSNDGYDVIFVSVEDGTKPAEDYAPSRKVRVELTYIPVEGEDYQTALDIIGERASSQVDKLLNRTAVSALVAAASAPATRARRTKEQIAADKAAEEAAKTPAAPADDPMGLGVQASSTTDATTHADAKAAEQQATVDDDMGLGITATAEPPKEITDKELVDAVQAKNATLKDPPRIKGVVAKFNPEGTPQPLLANIPQDRRSAFLSELNALA